MTVLIDHVLLETDEIEGLQDLYPHKSKAQDTPVILMSPVGAVTSSPQNLCASAWLTKPIKVSRLFDALSDVLFQPSTAVQENMQTDEQTPAWQINTPCASCWQRTIWSIKKWS